MSENSADVVLISTYELGHQPAGIAMPLGFFKREGIRADALDVSVEGFDAEKISRAKFIGISVPMHTALRLGVAIAQEIRRINADGHICFYGLYASLNSDYLLDTVADSIIGGEFETALVELIKKVLARDENATERLSIPAGVKTRLQAAMPVLARLSFSKPERTAMPGLERYARLDWQGEQRLAGYTEASRGCLHHCTHCPIPPIYEGRFFAVPREVVLEDIRQLVEAGAAHITFGDPDFLNGPTHALRVTESLHQAFPHLTFDFTAKIEHIIKHRELFKSFARYGCIFVVSAVEALSDEVLMRLEKRHTRNDVTDALNILREAGIAMRPSLVSFTPWTTLDDFIEVMDFVERENLIDAVDPVQYSIRLLVPPGSRLLEREETSLWLGKLNQPAFTYDWQHPDARMDELQRQVAVLVEGAAQRNEDTAVTFYRIRELAKVRRGDELAVRNQALLATHRIKPPRLTEAWFC
ncbi:MAG: CUAEP/CCAEP-tail radical SAM (seleno)protein [Acidobacteriota bacterium]